MQYSIQNNLIILSDLVRYCMLSFDIIQRIVGERKRQRVANNKQYFEPAVVAACRKSEEFIGGKLDYIIDPIIVLGSEGGW